MADAAARAGVRARGLVHARGHAAVRQAGHAWRTVLGGVYNVPHFDAKGEANAFFDAAGVPTTLLYTSFYWDNLIHFGMQPQRGPDGMLAVRAAHGPAKMPGIAAADIGACAYARHRARQRVRGQDDRHRRRAPLRRRNGRAARPGAGRARRHVSPSIEQYAAFGFPGADDLANMFHFYHDFEREFRAARDVGFTRSLYPKLHTFASWLAENVSRLPVEKRKA